MFISSILYNQLLDFPPKWLLVTKLTVCLPADALKFKWSHFISGGLELDSMLWKEINALFKDPTL